MFCFLSAASRSLCNLCTYLVADVIEEELGASRALDVDTTSQLDLLGLVALAVLEVGELLLEVSDIVGDMVL